LALWFESKQQITPDDSSSSARDVQDEAEKASKGDCMLGIIVFGAIGFSILYLLLGGGLGGAILIFIVAKMPGR
jgi:hypothetical protein